MPQDILTVPEEAGTYRTILAHGNEYLSFPEISPKDGGVDSLTVLHLGQAGLLEFAGGAEEPLLKPYLKADGSPVQVKMAWSYRHFWLPVFSGDAGSLAVRGGIFAPPGHRGAVYLLRVRNRGNRAVLVEAGFSVYFSGLSHHIFRGRRIMQDARGEHDRWTKSLILEGGAGLPLASLALGLDVDEPWWGRPVAGGACRADAAKTVRLTPGEELIVPLYMGVNREGSGAGTTVVDLRRHGWAILLQETEQWLVTRALPMSRFTSLANRNLFFNYFFALGRSIDTDQLVPVTSRSPRYYVSAAFWGRDCLLWSFPGLLLVDAKAARETLVAVFERHLERAGEHAHYINGVLLYPGFELDQLAAYFLALASYLRETGDAGVLEVKAVRHGLPQLAEKMLARRDDGTGLYATFLDPSDDPPVYPYLIYDNALAQRALVFMAKLQSKGVRFPENMKKAAEALQSAIWRHGTAEGPFGQMFAWAVDGEGNCQLYDNPPGSLQLLPHYGFCSREEPVWQNTVRWIHSEHNPFYRGEGKIKGPVSRHAGNPWPLAAANDLLGMNLNGGAFWEQAVMDSGFFCETVDTKRGRASTGHAFASAAGFGTYALWQAYGIYNTLNV